MAFWNKILKRAKKEKAETVETVQHIPEERYAHARRSSELIPMTGVLRAPHVTEKTTHAAKENKYVFLVNPRVNKFQIKKAIAHAYHVGVVAVHISNTPGKERRRGRITGWKPGFKKAIVTVKDGQKIEFTS